MKLVIFPGYTQVIAPLAGSVHIELKNPNYISGYLILIIPLENGKRLSVYTPRSYISEIFASLYFLLKLFLQVLII